jgi:DNA-binding transcriptional LysR family regulator
VINLKLLGYVQEIAKAGSMRRAATRLNISSSALNRQVLALEQDLDTQLFERLPKRLRLTASGEVLVAHAQEMAKAQARLLGRMAALKGLHRGTIRIATMGGLAHSPLLHLVNRFVAEHSDVMIRIEVADRDSGIAGRVLSGESDLGLGYNIAPNPALRVMCSLDVQIGVVVSPGHPLSRRPTAKLADCVGYPIATGPVATVIRDLTEIAFVSADLPMQPTVETDSIEIMKQLALSGHCLTFLNPLDISAELRRGDLVFVPLADRHFPVPGLQLIVRTRSSLEPATDRIAEDIRTKMSELQHEEYPGLSL